MTISLCMITKNEEDFIKACLESIKDHVNEIIIVDTGSTDNTCSIALSYGAKIYHQPWEDDFSKARNFGIEKAKGDWILYLDADETLDNSESLQTLIMKAEEDIDGYLFQILNYSDENLTQIENSVSLRLFRNKSELRFFGAIHEQLPIKDTFLAMTDFTIHHYGYIPSVSLAKKKSERNLEILQKEIEKNVGDGFLYYNLASEYARLHQFDKAITYYIEALNRVDGETGYESRAYKMLGLSLLQIKQWEQCTNYLTKGIRKFSDYPDLYYIRALCFEAEGKWNEAIIDLLQCLTMDALPTDENKIYVTEEGITNYKAFYNLGRIYEKLEKIQAALTAYTRAFKVNPRYKAAFMSIKKWVPNDQKHLLEFLNEKVFHENKLVEKIVYVQALFEWKEYDLVIELMKDNPKKDEQGNYLLGMSYFMIHQFEEGTPYLSKVRKGQQRYEEVLPYLASSLWITNRIQKAKKLLSACSSPGKHYHHMADIFLTIGIENLQEGLKKYPDSTLLQKEYERIKRVRADGRNHSPA